MPSPLASHDAAAFATSGLLSLPAALVLACTVEAERPRTAADDEPVAAATASESEPRRDGARATAAMPERDRGPGGVAPGRPAPGPREPDPALDPALPPSVEIPQRLPPTPLALPPAPDPALALREATLTAFGTAVLAALRAGDLEAFLRLTPHAAGPIHEACPQLAAPADRRELAARFDFCHRAIDWRAVTDVRIGGALPSGEEAPECEPGVEALERVQMVVHLGRTRWQVDLFGAVGREAGVFAVSGAISCRELPASTGRRR